LLPQGALVACPAARRSQILDDNAHNSADDPDLRTLRLVAEGDQHACAALVDRHLTRLHAAAGRMLGDQAEAEDVCQEVFMRLWTQAPRWQEGRAKLSTWLYRVMLNACHDRLRKRRPEVDLDEQLQSEQPGPEQAHAQEQRQRRLLQALDRLPPRQRQAMALCHDARMSQVDAAMAMEISESALESLLARARRTLRAALSEQALPPPIPIQPGIKEQSL